MANLSATQISKATDELVRLQDRVSTLEAYVKYVAGLEGIADEYLLFGWVDNPHIKVLRAASRKARELIKPSLAS